VAGSSPRVSPNRETRQSCWYSKKISRLNAGAEPQPMLGLHLRHGKIVAACDPATTPDWAKPIVVTALKLSSK